MTKEELEKEALEKYKTGSYPQIHPDHYAFIHGYVAGAEPREKRIAELEELLINSKNLSDTIEKAQKEQISHLEKELAISEHDREHNDEELVEVYKKVEQLVKENEQKADQLTKATELLKQFLEADTDADLLKAQWYAEQFIKEIKENG